MLLSRLNLREIVEEQSYQKALESHRLDVQEIDKALEGVTFALARNPETFPSLDGLSRVRIKAPCYDASFNIWFQYDRETVRLVEIDRVDEDGNGM